MPATEHFVTLFDRAFLPSGISLYRSLEAHAKNFALWVLCMDDETARVLTSLKLPQVRIITLREIETPELLNVKSDRSWGEYCWTLSSFTYDAVFARCPEAERVTYLDADLMFLADPQELLGEMPSDKHVLVTEHAYAPEYDQSHLSGRFCVQFLTFDQSAAASTVRKWWQGKVIEECSSRPTSLGDQGYLDEWPKLFGNDLHIIRQSHRTLAPWNVKYMLHQHPGISPVFYHFHGLRFIEKNRIRLYSGYQVGAAAGPIYQEYLARLISAIKEMRSVGGDIKPLPIAMRLRNRLGMIYRLIRGRERCVNLTI